MKKDFYTVSKTAGAASDPMIRKIALPGGATAHILRRDVYERALQAAGKVLARAIVENRANKGQDSSGVSSPDVA